jgi:hypothetical protein
VEYVHNSGDCDSQVEENVNVSLDIGLELHSHRIGILGIGTVIIIDNANALDKPNPSFSSINVGDSTTLCFPKHHIMVFY